MKKHVLELILIFMVFTALAFVCAAGRDKSKTALDHQKEVVVSDAGAMSSMSLVSGSLSVK